MKIRPGLFATAAGLLTAAIAPAQTLQTGVTYVCSGERIVIDSCNVRDVSDTSTCMVGHPDKVRNGLMAYSTETRGALKKLLPTCKQPSADEVARVQAFQKKQEDLHAAAEKKANAENDAIEARAQAVITGKKPQSADEKAMNRCITAGRLPAVCMGNALSKPFDAIVGSILPSVGGPLPPGPHMGGNFEGPGSWRVEFDDRFAMMKCAGMDLDQHSYALSLNNNRATITIDSTPKPVVLTLRPDGGLAGPGPITVNGIIYKGTRDEVNTVERTTTHVHEFERVTRACVAPVLSSNGAAPSAVNVASGVLTGLFSDGDKGPPTPPGLRMHGTYGGQGGISLEFFPETVIIGCGDAARAYPYEVQASGTQTILKIADPARPVVFTLKNGELDADPGPYEVHGRVITGQDNNDNFTFAPFNKTCNLGVLKAGATAAAPPAMTSTAPGIAPNSTGLPQASPGNPTGNALLTIISGFPNQPGVPNVLAVHPYILLRDDFATAIAKAGFPVPPGSTAFKVMGANCGPGRTPDCQRLLAGINADTASTIRSDVTGKAIFPGVPPGTYYLMISALYNQKTIFWGFKVELKAGPNILTLDARSAVPVN
jgi:hypothetical protein